MTATDIQLIETIRVQPGRHVPLLAGHQKRLEASCEALGYPWPGAALHAALHLHVSQLDVNNSHRLRLLLGADGRYSLESNPLAPTPEPVRLSLRSVPLQAESFWLQHKTTRSEEHTSELQSLMRISYAVFCLKKKNTISI